MTVYFFHHLIISQNKQPLNQICTLPKCVVLSSNCGNVRFQPLLNIYFLVLENLWGRILRIKDSWDFMFNPRVSLKVLLTRHQRVVWGKAKFSQALLRNQASHKVSQSFPCYPGSPWIWGKHQAEFFLWIIKTTLVISRKIV